jgi:hypothetical protein
MFRWVELGDFERLLTANSRHHASLGDNDQALAAFEMGLERSFKAADAIQNTPYFAALRHDPGFVQMIESHT